MRKSLGSKFIQEIHVADFSEGFQIFDERQLIDQRVRIRLCSLTCNEETEDGHQQQSHSPNQ